MSLKSLSNENRIIFLKKFTNELILAIAKKHIVKQNIDFEKFNIKMNETKMKEIPRISPPTIQYKGYNPSISSNTPRTQAIPQINNNNMKPTNITKKINQNQKETNLLKILPLIRDQSIQSIECSGPGKNIMVKRFNKMQLTRIILNKDEISNIINEFSQKAKIPLIGGILKAAVGNLILSAVVSDFVGSRFIINKITPYTLIHPNRVIK